jgi:hypothetical protein
VVAGEPVDACGGGSLFGGRDGSGRRIDGLRGGERQRKVVSRARAVSYRAVRRRGGVACCGRHPVGRRGAGLGRRKKKKEGREERRKEKERKKRKRENEERN